MNISTALVRLRCILVDDKLVVRNSPFNISVPSEEEIGEFVNYVKNTTPSVRDKDHGKFSFYQPPLDCPIRVTESLPGSQLTRKDLGTLLLIPFTVGEVFQEKGADHRFDIDVIVHLDYGENGGGVILHTLRAGSSNTWLRRITFHLRNRDEAQLPPETKLDTNNISEFSADSDGALPDYIEQLEQELRLRCSPRHDMTILPLLASVKAHLGDDTFGKHFTDVNDGSETHCVTDIELLHYLDALIDRNLSNQAAYRNRTESHVYSLLRRFAVDPLSESPRSAKLSFDAPWIFGLAVKTRDNQILHQYTPRSDVFFGIGGFPHVLLEISSDKKKRDHCRMLLQASRLVHLGNMLISDKSPTMSLECSIPAVFLQHPWAGPKPALNLRTDHPSGATIPCKSASSVPSSQSASFAPPRVLHHPRSSEPRRVSLSSDMSDYDFSQFGQWDGDSASYYHEDDQPPTPQVLPHLRPPTTSVFRQSPPPLRFPSPLTPIDFGGEEPVASTSGIQYEYTVVDINGAPLSGLPSPITRPSTPIKEEEEFDPEFDIQMQVAVRSTPHFPSPELVYPDPPSEPAPVLRAVSAPPRVPSCTSTPPCIPTPDSPIDYKRVAEQAAHFEQENLAPAVPLFRPPSCLNSPEDHPHPYTAIYTAEGESWRPASESVRDYLVRLPLIPTLVNNPRVFPSVSPFRITPPHVYRIFLRSIDPSVHPDFPPLYICSKAIFDLPCPDLPLGSIWYDFRDGLGAAFTPLSNLIRAGYIDTLVTLEIHDFLDGRVVTTYGHLHFTFRGQVTAHYQGYFFEDITSNPSRARANFNTHRDRQVRWYYPSTSYYDLSESSRIDCWTDPPLVLKNLINLFEFGETWDHDSHNEFVNDLSGVVDACNDQLLFWHLSDIITDQLLLWTKSDYLWFNYIPPRHDYLI
ncbi:hypothetical protein EDB84DRAFT_1442447 [Lactarius hengduanensis]|nr:hypothetical protein EDB84DRAFT_1442447 [Lactarius hengduanensis]